MQPHDEQLARRFRRVSYLTPRFSEEVLGIPWLLASHGTRLSDFSSLAPHEELSARILEAFDIDTASLPDDLLLTLFERFHELHPLTHDSPQDAITWALRLNNVLAPESQPSPSLLDGLLSTLNRSADIKTLQSRLPAILWSEFGRKGTKFERWDLLAEDLWSIRQPQAPLSTTSRSTDRKTRRWLIVREIVNRHDPADLLSMGCPEDEYDPEVPGILAAIESASDATNLANKTKQLFEQMLGIKLQFKAWPTLAEELWRISRTQKW